MKKNKYVIKIIFVLIIMVNSKIYSQRYPTNNPVIYDSLTAILEIKNIYKQILEGQNFGDLATKFTQDPGSFKNYGILKKISLDDLDEGFAYYVEKMKIGDVSQPFESIFGWHITKLLDIDKEKKYSIQHILIMYKSN